MQFVILGSCGKLVAHGVPYGVPGRHARVPHAPAHALPAHAHTVTVCATAALALRHQVQYV